jgi:membrane fusion protein (multidrug efflux system)
MADSKALRKPNQRKRLIIVVLVVVILFALLIGFNTFKGIMIGKFMKSMANPTQTVSTMTTEYQDWQPHVQAVGNVRAVHGADLAFDVAGLVDSVDV